MPVRCIADAGDYQAAFRQRRLGTEFVIVTVKVIHVLRDHFALEILPGTAANAIARIDRRLIVCRLGAQIRVPRPRACTSPLRKLLALTVGSLKTADIRTLPGTGARHKKGHVRRLRSLLLCLRLKAKQAKCKSR
jgi:hypothetical protein